MVIVVPSCAGSILAKTETTPALTEPIVTQHRLTQADINVLIDDWAPSYGLDPKLVKKISKCESQGNPYARHPNVRKGETEAWSVDYGPLQINDFYHESIMKRRGMNIRNPAQSLQYGLEMMKKQGTKPWSWSKWCWGK